MSEADLRSLRRQNDLLRERITELESHVRRLSGDDEAERAQRYLGLSVSESKIFGFMVRRGSADYGLLAEALYWDNEYPEDVTNAVRAVMKRMRRKIRPLGMDMTTEYRVGWSMTDAVRARARELLEGDQT